jgi:hypothetical protein
MQALHAQCRNVSALAPNVSNTVAHVFLSQFGMLRTDESANPQLLESASTQTRAVCMNAPEFSTKPATGTHREAKK